ncbi:uncharacterized protein LOC134256698, partial [Saccostrea cucullata]|uniref:uncharacterized protein LOC134256698 n=1 Tax=Saccostrea cuccullata TaxID=36930 RepID=UPI002ED180CE
MKEFLTTQEGSIQNFSAVDIFVETEELQRVWCLTELPESVFDAQWYPSFSTDVLIVIVGISDICLTHPEKLKNMLSACHQKLVNSETRKTYFVTNKWDTLDDDDKRESIKIMQSFKTMLSECWPDPITEEHLFCTSLSKTTTFVQDMEKLKKEIQDTATSFFHFSADEAMEKTMSITQYLLKLFQNEEFQEHFKKELPNLPDIIVRKQKEIKSTEAIVVVAGDTSAGKTSFINKLLRRQIFEPRTLASTACVCRIRKSKVEKIEFYTTENDFLCSVDIEGPTMLFEKLRSYTELDKKKQINGKDIHYVDIYMSSETLQNHMVLVDTPGIGFKKSLDEILFDYLPNASCFIFVVDAANAGGFRENRLLRILKVVVDKQAEMPFFDIKDVIFLTNKWDNIDSEDDSSDEDEEFLSTEETHGGSDKEKTFSHILDTLYREWSTLSKENVYKVCLKQNEGEYEDDFRRFERKLLGVVEKTKNRLMFDHL